MNKEQRERLSQLDPEVRVGRMQGLLRGIIRSDFTSTHDMIRFVNLFVVHSPTVQGHQNEFFEQLDQPELMFCESTFDTIVASYDDLTGHTESQEVAK
jgi:hypothetical protein